MINNPIAKGVTHEEIKKEIEKIKSVVYFCMADEAGQTKHTHIFLACSSAVRFSTLKRHFSTAHLEMARGMSEENRAYIAKSGKWANDKKHGTSIPGTFEESGEMPVGRQGARNDLADLHDYVWGTTGAGKTRSIMERHGFASVYRVTDYEHPFDTYAGQAVLMLDEHRGQFLIHAILNYLDGYPLELPCRYANRIACYTEVYIVSNVDLWEQYPNVQREQPATWAAFLRRIYKVVKFFQTGGRPSIPFKSMRPALCRWTAPKQKTSRSQF